MEDQNQKGMADGPAHVYRAGAYHIAAFSPDLTDPCDRVHSATVPENFAGYFEKQTLFIAIHYSLIQRDRIEIQSRFNPISYEKPVRI